MWNIPVEEGYTACLQQYREIGLKFVNRIVFLKYKWLAYKVYLPKTM